MSRAPISSGTQKLPKPPIRIGVTAKKIMIVPCIVNSDVYAAGEITPPAPGNSSRPTSGTGCAGARQLPADQHRHHAADGQEREPEEQELAADHLVIGREDAADPDARRGVPASSAVGADAALGGGRGH